MKVVVAMIAHVFGRAGGGEFQHLVSRLIRIVNHLAMVVFR
jgi:hypothetical protein